MASPRPPPLRILLAESAERPFLALPFAMREQLRRIFEGIAELAAVTPPIDPVWRKVPHFGRPVMRFTHLTVEVYYELNLDEHHLRIVGIRELGATSQSA